MDERGGWVSILGSHSLAVKIKSWPKDGKRYYHLFILLLKLNLLTNLWCQLMSYSLERQQAVIIKPEIESGHILPCLWVKVAFPLDSHKRSNLFIFFLLTKLAYSLKCFLFVKFDLNGFTSKVNGSEYSKAVCCTQFSLNYSFLPFCVLLSLCFYTLYFLLFKSKQLYTFF